ncbi:MAG: RdgB/HAM1 family non-canonical purine NTP pyrophosphatase [Phycisphaerales bacterium]
MTPPIELVVATGNPHKVAEIRAVLAPLGVRALSLAEVTTPDGKPGSDLPEPVEDADTFAGNAQIKAVAYAAALGRPCLADDSGLEVDALNGAPGVHSARYAGEGDSRAERDSANNAKLLREMASVPDDRRDARFLCCMCLAAPDGAILAESRGTFGGVIGRAPKGEHGFGYDPLLILEDGRTSAELPPDEKNARSHRGEALRAIAPRVVEALAT